MLEDTKQNSVNTHVTLQFISRAFSNKHIAFIQDYNIMY